VADRLKLPMGGAALLPALGAGVGVAAGISPKLGLVAAFGLVFVVLVIADLLIGLCFFTIVIFIEVLPSFGSAFFSFSKLAGLLLAVSWLATLASGRRQRRGIASAHPFLVFALGLLLGIGAVSLTWAGTPDAGVTPLTRYALDALLFLIVYTAIREPRDMVLVLGAYVLGATAAAAYGIISPPAPTSEQELARATGTIGDANELAAVLVPAVVLGLVLAAYARRAPMLRLLCIVAAVLCVVGTFLSLSRGGLIALSFALIAMVFVGGRWRMQALVATVLIALVTLGWFEFVASQAARDRITHVHGGAGRSDIWTVGWRMVRANPIGGVGLGNFQSESVHYLLAPGAIKRSDFIVDTPKVAHNTYLQVLAELGIVGLVPFLMIVITAVLCGLRAARRFAARGDPRMELLARGLVVALLGMLAADFFISEEFSKQLWLLLGLGPAMLALATRPAGEEAADETAPGERPRTRAPILPEVGPARA
jgi:O-antigen ligase